jgi:hypothetical protein
MNLFDDNEINKSESLQMQAEQHDSTKREVTNDSSLQGERKELEREKSELEIALNYVDSMEFRNRLVEIEKQLNKLDALLNPDQVIPYYSKKLGLKFIWNESKKQAEFEDGVVYSYKEICDLFEESNETELKFIHGFKQTFDVKYEGLSYAQRLSGNARKTSL